MITISYYYSNIEITIVVVLPGRSGGSPKPLPHAACLPFPPSTLTGGSNIVWVIPEGFPSTALLEEAILELMKPPVPSGSALPFYITHCSVKSITGLPDLSNRLQEPGWKWWLKELERGRRGSQQMRWEGVYLGFGHVWAVMSSISIWWLLRLSISLHPLGNVRLVLWGSARNTYLQIRAIWTRAPSSLSASMFPLHLFSLPLQVSLHPRRRRPFQIGQWGETSGEAHTGQQSCSIRLGWPLILWRERLRLN